MKSNRPATPLFATINVTGVCNLRCRYCFFQPRREEHMPEASFRRVVDELKAGGAFFVNISGGEPFTHPRIDSLLRHAHEAFQHVVVLTNGTRLAPHHVRTIAEIVERKGGFPVQVSLDSIDESVNTRTRSRSGDIVRNLRLLGQLGADIVVAIVLTAHNADSVLETIRTLSAHARHFHVMTVQRVRGLADTDQPPALPRAVADSLWAQIADLRDRHGLYIETPLDEPTSDPGSACGAPCMAGFTSVVIDPDLKVRPCDRCVSTFVGDLGWQSLDEVWQGEPLAQVLASPIAYCRRDDPSMTAPLPL